MNDTNKPLDCVIVTMVSNSGVKEETVMCYTALALAGAEHVMVVGISDIALARNIALDGALLDHKVVHTHMLFLDSDIVLTPDQAMALLNISQQTERAVAARYPKKDGTESWSVCKDAELGDFVLCGLGAMMIPLSLLRQYRLRLIQGKRVFNYGDSVIPAYCQTGPGYIPGKNEPTWIGEDYHLCRALKPMLADIEVGHIKGMIAFGRAHPGGVAQ